MSLPTPNLDDLRFQKDLVDEARRRINRYCPEWTDYNVSDPGITLIELFAWMTEQLVYRLNRVPEKNYRKFLELLGVRLRAAESARTELTFRLSTPFPTDSNFNMAARVPGGTEVAARASGQEPEIVFTTDTDMTIYPPRLSDVRRSVEFPTNYCVPGEGVRPFDAFTTSPRPQEQDALYLGFDESRDISGHILRLTFTCDEARRVSGIQANDPPWVWECLTGNGASWHELTPSEDKGEENTTEGLVNARGQIVLYLPLRMTPTTVAERKAYWLRCRLEQRRQEQGSYTASPRILNVEAHALGATATAYNAVVVRNEILGKSSGDPGQSFRLAHFPILQLAGGETVEVEETGDGQKKFAAWTHVEDFSGSDRFDRHFVLDPINGEVLFGPCIRRPDGGTRQYGRIPEVGATIRFRQYRYGGGTAGNVPPGRIVVLKSSVPYIDQVANRDAAQGGLDEETIEEAQMRAQAAIRAQNRAVTAEDYEVLTLREYGRAVARVKALAARPLPDLPPAAPSPGPSAAPVQGGAPPTPAQPAVQAGSPQSTLPFGLARPSAPAAAMPSGVTFGAARPGAPLAAPPAGPPPAAGQAGPPPAVAQYAPPASPPPAATQVPAPLAPQGAVPPGTVQLLIVPGTGRAVKVGDLASLHLDDELANRIAKYLDQYRLLTTRLQIREPRYWGVKVCAEIENAQGTQFESVRDQVDFRLRTLISPLARATDAEGLEDLVGPEWEGWPFGRPLYMREVYSLIQRTPGVERVRSVQLFKRQVDPAAERKAAETRPNPDEESTPEPQEEEQLTEEQDSCLKIGPDAVLCSLDHEIARWGEQP